MTYKLFKKKFGFENHLIKIPRTLMRYLLIFRTNNHRLPIERGRWTYTEMRDRVCDLCLENIGDEYHYYLNAKISLKNEYHLYQPNKHNVYTTQNLLRITFF